MGPIDLINVVKDPQDEVNYATVIELYENLKAVADVCENKDRQLRVYQMLHILQPIYDLALNPSSHNGSKMVDASLTLLDHFVEHSKSKKLDWMWQEKSSDSAKNLTSLRDDISKSHTIRLSH